MLLLIKLLGLSIEYLTPASAAKLTIMSTSWLFSELNKKSRSEISASINLYFFEYCLLT